MSTINIAAAAVAIARYISIPQNIKNEQQLRVVRTTYEELFSQIERHIDSMMPQAISNCLWSLGKLVKILGLNFVDKQRLLQVYDTLYKRMLVIRNEMDKQSISICFGVIADLKNFAKKDIEDLVLMIKTINNFNEIELSSILCQVATLEFQDEYLINHLTKQILKHRNIIPWNIANFLWALAQLDKKDDKLIKHLTQIVRRRNDFIVPQSISRALWALAKMGYHNEQIIQQLLNFNKIDRNFTIQDISYILWALGFWKYSNVKIIKNIMNIAKNKIQEMNEKDIGNILWSLNQLRYFDTNFLQIVEKKILSSQFQFSNQMIANILFTFAEFGLNKKERVISVLVQQFNSNNQSTPQELISVLYALSLLNTRLEIVQNLLEQFLIQQELTIDNLLQLVQLRRAQIQYSSKNQRLILPQNIEQRCKQGYQQHMKSISEKRIGFVSQVFRFIKLQGINCQQQVLVEDGEIGVDILIQQCGSNKIGVFAHGKGCYALNDHRVLLGKSQSAASLLRNLGWKVIQVSEYEWYKSTDYQQVVIKQIQESM
eukprot:TRINITY_DN3615_c0_g1_i3.p1 TRINITY_DN3615_c0_g1~~TRINITY_DN3615_c0_g1_i3.p1  ORF type:complete len:544 (-),score=32.62 TRINITY_DN3615_c0_g1_i3:298-1929(-)